ncbi:hypothetical protein IC229_29015 [Spirosoma sp. BT702]|uniref:Uncharacterized protein n=1 Tax=Spirosoma profusum TaxID=2771354 RepID=A0A927AUL9_9BACT|nr:hypothetical protein [Spirosoma profusum]MBD2704711.1 hypothetical protein [Spirosoma profusum]
MTTSELTQILQANALMQSQEQEERFFQALETLEMRHESEFNDSVFEQLCAVFTDNTGRMDGIGAINRLLDVMYLQAKSPKHFYNLLNKNIDAFFPHASGWLATIIAEGIYTTDISSVLVEKLNSFKPIQAIILKDKLQELFHEEIIPAEAENFLVKLAQRT